MKKCLISSCLVGLCTRYDGQSKPDERCLKYLNDFIYIPVCPEQLGGLSTPRPAADLRDGDGMDVLTGFASVITRDGMDVTKEFIAGAEGMLKIAQDQNIRLALLKARSPSCGVKKLGVTAALLERNGIKLVEF
ncbi:2-thiouracil desulfurase [Candidatus Electrothrix laxa]